MATYNFAGIMKYFNEPPVPLSPIIKVRGSYFTSSIVGSATYQTDANSIKQGYERHGIGIASFVTQPPPVYLRTVQGGYAENEVPGASATITFGSKYDTGATGMGLPIWGIPFNGTYTLDETKYFPEESGGFGVAGNSVRFGFFTGNSTPIIASGESGSIFSAMEGPFAMSGFFGTVGGDVVISIGAYPYETDGSGYPKYNSADLTFTYDTVGDSIKVHTEALPVVHGMVRFPGRDNRVIFPLDTLPIVNVKIGVTTYTFTDYGAVIKIDGPFTPRDLGAVSAWTSYSNCALESPHLSFNLSPFLNVDTYPVFQTENMNIPDEYSSYEPLKKDDLGLFQSNGFVRVNRTIGFGSMPDSYRLNLIRYSGTMASSLLPTFGSNESVFISQWFPQSAAGLGRLAIEALDSSGNVVATTFLQSFSESNKTINQQLFTPHPPPDLEVIPIIESGVLKNFNIKLANGVFLTDRTYPTSIFMPDASVRLLTFSTFNKKWELYKVNARDMAGGYAFMSYDVWGGAKYAARLGRFVNGNLFSTAWELDADLVTFKALFKTSLDGGITWEPESIIATRVDNPLANKFDSFQPTYSVVESLTRGTLSFDKYKSNDMGATWN